MLVLMAKSNRFLMLTVLISLGLAGGIYLGLDAVAGRILGSIVGTTTDPRNPSIRNIRAFSMEPIRFDLFDPRAIDRIKAGELDGVDTHFSMEVPAAYVVSVITQDFGPRRERDRITSVGVEFLINSDAPFTLEQQRMMLIVAEDMGLHMLTPDERNYRESRPWPSFPDRATQWRFREEMERRGIVPVRATFRAVLATPEIERRRHVLGSMWVGGSSRAPQSSFAPKEGCMVSEGPFPNSVRYDHSPDVFDPVPEGTRRSLFRGSCMSTFSSDAFIVVQYDQNGDYLWAMNCENFGPGGINNCVAAFLWGGLNTGLVAVDRAYMLRMPEFIERARALFKSFRDAAELSTERGA